MEGDLIAISLHSPFIISIHSLRMEGDLRNRDLPRPGIHFNPLPPHGGRRVYKPLPDLARHFNPLPPHGGRLMPIVIFFFSPTFQSTPSAWRETDTLKMLREKSGISIHSLRMEGDICTFTVLFFAGHFNPLPPHGGRLSRLNRRLSLFSFQSTPSAWRETAAIVFLVCAWKISIHSLRMEGDIEKAYPSYRTGNFNPLPPHGGRHAGKY